MSVTAQRPRTVTLVGLLLAFLGILQVAKGVAISEQSGLLLELQVRPDPRLRMGVAIAWTVIFWTLAITLWRGVEVTRWLAPLAMAFVVAYELLVPALFAQVPISEQRWLQYIAIAVVLVVFTAWALNNGKARAYFAEEKLADVS